MKKIISLCALLMLWAQLAIAGININTADQQALESLPGIGPAKAAAIISYRAEHGEFSSPEDLTKVKGIGHKILANIADQIETD